MTALNKNRWDAKHQTQQRGVVLFIALMALVVLALASVALVRSVDTSTLIAGNLAFTQSATTSADSGMESAIEWLSANAGSLNNDDEDAGYYSFVDDNPSSGTYLDLMSDGTWEDNASAFATGTDITNGTDTSGNTVRYVIQRMCSATGAPTTEKCLFGPPGEDDSSHRSDNAASGSASTTIMYRVTAKVTGPRNTVSYIQAFVY